jgi:hypothetical protein
MEEIHNIDLLKKLASQAEKLSQSHMTENPYWRNAYKLIALGTSLLWRLLDQGGQEKPIRR